LSSFADVSFERSLKDFLLLLGSDLGAVEKETGSESGTEAPIDGAGDAAATGLGGGGVEEAPIDGAGDAAATGLEGGGVEEAPSNDAGDAATV
jgi:hypothetical protein